MKYFSPNFNDNFYFRFECTISACHTIWQTRNFYLVLVTLPARVCALAEAVPLRVLPEVHEVAADSEEAHHEVCLETSARHRNLQKGNKYLLTLFIRNNSIAKYVVFFHSQDSFFYRNSKTDLTVNVIDLEG